MRNPTADTSPGPPGDHAIQQMPQAAPARRLRAVPHTAPPRRSRVPLALLGSTAVAVVAAQTAMPHGIRARSIVASAVGALAAAVAAGVALQASRRPDAWASTRRYGVALVALALVQAGFLASAILRPADGPLGGGAVVDLAVVGMAALL